MAGSKYGQYKGNDVMLRVLVSSKDREELHGTAERLNISVSEIGRRAIRQYLAEQATKKQAEAAAGSHL